MSRTYFVQRASIRHTTSRFSLDNATASILGDLQEPRMSKPYKSTDPLTQKHAPSDAGRAEKDAARLGRDPRGWVAANKRPGKEFEVWIGLQLFEVPALPPCFLACRVSAEGLTGHLGTRLERGTAVGAKLFGHQMSPYKSCMETLVPPGSYP